MASKENVKFKKIINHNGVPITNCFFEETPENILATMVEDEPEGFEGPLFNCPELGYDCGDCNEDWDDSDLIGFCSEECSSSGDINNDSILNILDIVSMITLILNGEFNECGDVNSDGDLNILDVITFVNIILSIP